uniref:AP complex subunit sigma n=1 Tax=Acrobeloides nanus TaxID=290746 RepID=A0A914D2K2_9BILA
MIHYFLCFNSKSQIRLQKWYSNYNEIKKKQIIKDVMKEILDRKTNVCLFFEECEELTIVYRKYAALYFVLAIDPNDNALLAMDIIQRYVELLDKYFKNVCELNIIFDFHKAYYVLDEFILNGEIQEYDKDLIINAVREYDQLQKKENEEQNEVAQSTSSARKSY